MLELLKGHTHCCIDIDGRGYEIDFLQLSQTNVRTKKNRKVRCQFGFPAHWHMSDEDVLKKVLEENPKGSQEASSPQVSLGWRSFLKELLYRSSATPLTNASLAQTNNLAPWETIQKVTDPQMLLNLADLLNKSTMRQDGARCFCRAGFSFWLIEVYQVKNLYLWRRYQRCVQSINDKHGQYGIRVEKVDLRGDALRKFAQELGVDESSNEGLFFHGTPSFDRAQQIAKEGFDSRVAASTGLYGKGTYFAVQSCKAAQYATAGSGKASSERMGTMFLARVAIGDPWYATGANQYCRSL